MIFELGASAVSLEPMTYLDCAVQLNKEVVSDVMHASQQ